MGGAGEPRFIIRAATGVGSFDLARGFSEKVEKIHVPGGGRGEGGK